MQLSELDTARFGVRIARDSELGLSTLEPTLEACRDQGVRMLVVRCPSHEHELLHALEARGGRLMDTLLVYSRPLENLPPERASFVRPLAEGDVEGVKALAAEAFRGYGGHYHADPRLDRERADLAYVDWAARSCTEPGVCDQVLVADEDGAIIAFATLRMNDPREGEGVLFAVAPRAQGRGLYRTLMQEGAAWCRDRGAERMRVSTQLTNVAVQKVWSRLGFELRESFHTFHLWFD